MYIRNENGATRRIYDDDLMAEHYDPPGIEFDDDGVARVRKDVGEALVESDEWPTIVDVDDGGGDGDAPPSDSGASETDTETTATETDGDDSDGSTDDTDGGDVGDDADGDSDSDRAETTE